MNFSLQKQNFSFESSFSSVIEIRKSVSTGNALVNKWVTMILQERILMTAASHGSIDNCLRGKKKKK